jgi:hypothetical protein
MACRSSEIRRSDPLSTKSSKEEKNVELFQHFDEQRLSFLPISVTFFFKSEKSNPLLVKLCSCVSTQNKMIRTNARSNIMHI